MTKGLERNYLLILRGAPGEPGGYQYVLRIGEADTKKAADHGISGIRHGRVTQTGPASIGAVHRTALPQSTALRRRRSRRPRPKGSNSPVDCCFPSARPATSRPLCNEPRCPAGPSFSVSPLAIRETWGYLRGIAAGGQR